MVAGGRILARYEAPADEFLFPKVPLRPGQLRTLSLNKSRNYQAKNILSVSSKFLLTIFYSIVPN